jgi:hypothetical protein
MKYLFRSSIVAVALFLVCAPIAYAGFGITPPYVKNASLTRTSLYEQEIVIVRSDPTIDLRAEITFDVPGANEWLSVDKGKEFILPKGEQQVRMKVLVKVPDDAPFKSFKGNIRIRTSPADGSRTGAGSVSIALGAQLDVDLVIIDKKIFDFRIRKIQISDLNEGHRVWWLDYPGKIRFLMTVENIGNVPVSPSKVVFNIYDAKGETLLERVQNLNKLEKVTPFETKDVLAELPTRLSAGSYVARYAIYGHDGEVKQEGELNVSILPYGKVAGDSGFGFAGLSTGDKASILLPIVVLCILLVRAFFSSRRRTMRRS